MSAPASPPLTNSTTTPIDATKSAAPAAPVDIEPADAPDHLDEVAQITASMLRLSGAIKPAKSAAVKGAQKKMVKAMLEVAVKQLSD